MLKLLLVPLDTSSFAEQALPHALALARRAQAKLRVVFVAAPFPASLSVEEDPADYLARITARLEPQLPGAISHAILADELAPVYPPPGSSEVADVLSRYAQEQEVDIIVMATHGRGGVRRAWLGSVADSLIRITARPVLLIRPKDEEFGSAAAADRGLRHIIIPVDGSDTAEQVIPFALDLGSAFEARYSLVRVVSPLAWGSYEAQWAPALPLSRAAVAQYLDRVATRIREHGARVTTRVLEAFSPGSAIVQYADADAGDAIALSTTGAGRVRRMLLGSVTDKVVRSSEVPVLVCNIRRLERITAIEHETATAAAGAASG